MAQVWYRGRTKHAGQGDSSVTPPLYTTGFRLQVQKTQSAVQSCRRRVWGNMLSDPWWRTNHKEEHKQATHASCCLVADKSQNHFSYTRQPAHARMHTHTHLISHLFIDNLINKTQDTVLLTVFFFFYYKKKAYIRTEAMEILRKS